MKGILLTTAMLILMLSGCAVIGVWFHYSPSDKILEVNYEVEPANPEYNFIFPDTLKNEYLRKLRQGFGLDAMTAGLPDEFQKIKTILDWVHRQWNHDGSNTPSQNDPVSILEEARKGKNFRCVEYGIVSAASLNSLAIPARVLGLKTADVEKVKFGAGHVAAECFSREFRKWIFMDGQFNVIPVINSLPLNAVEFQKAIDENSIELKLVNLKGELPENEKEEYLHWIRKYLYYLDVSFDNRNIPGDQKIKIIGKPKLMLIPVTAKAPEVFQRSGKMNSYNFTSNLNDFYQNPF